MKSQKGITLMSLTIYVIVFTLVIGIVATLTSYFYKNVMSFDETTKSYSEINKFNMYFLQDIKEDGVTILNFIQSEDNKNIGITLYNSNNYETYEYKFEENNKAIYRNGKLISKNINSFQLKINEDNNNILNILIETQGAAGAVKTMTYSING